MFGIPSNKLVVLLKHEFIIRNSNKNNASVRSEVYNLMWRKSKKIEEGPKLDD
jgi:hypothetical protein